MQAPSQEHFPSAVRKIAEVGSAAAGVAIFGTATLHEYDAYGWTTMPWAEAIPGANHAGSMAASYTIGILAVGATDMLAAGLRARHPNLARHVERAASTTAWLGSLAYQITAETVLPGFHDWQDVLAGLAATVPGILCGRLFARLMPKTKSTTSGRRHDCGANPRLDLDRLLC